ncbi:MAG: TMEM175 family protein [Anaerolineae bacterium]
MTKSRLEAFSDGVLAIIITIMVLELRAPEGDSLAALREIIPTLLGYALSFVFVGIYWNNHHHLFQAVQVVDGRVLWANLHLLFWLSLVPFATAWMGDNGFSSWPVAFYGTVLLLAGAAYYVLVRTLLVRHGEDSVLARAIGIDTKGRLSLVLYALGIVLAVGRPLWACALYVLVAVIWLVPDRRIERHLS